jgi:hypothetical protein
MLRCAARRADGREVRLALHVRSDNRERTPPLVRLLALGGPGDGEPVIAVLLPDEAWATEREQRRGTLSPILPPDRRQDDGSLNRRKPADGGAGVAFQSSFQDRV